MSGRPGRSAPVLVVGGGIGGMAAALALSQRGIDVEVFEQSVEIGEIGAGLQLGPNGFAAMDALGVGERARARAVFTDELVMMDAIDGGEVARIPVGPDFRRRFNNP
jgi:3-hydroxybenzoate 6-monooxygenase